MSKPLYVRDLSIDEINQLKTQLHSENREIRQRAKILLESAEKKTAYQIAKQVNISPENIKRWVRRFNEESFKGIGVRKRGPDPFFTKEQIEAIYGLVSQSPLELGFNFNEWSPQKLANAAQSKGLVKKISHVTVRKLLKQFDSSQNFLPENIKNISPPPGNIWLRISSLKNKLQNQKLSSNQEASLRCTLSEAFESVGHYKEVLSIIKPYESLEVYLRLDSLWQAETRLRLGWGYSWQGDHPRAIARMNEALKLFTNLNNIEGMGSTHYAIGRTYTEINEFKIGRDHILQGLQLLTTQIRRKNIELGEYNTTNRSEMLKAKMHLSLGVIDFCEGNFNAAKINYTDALEFANTTSPDQNLLGLILMNLALIHDQMGERRKAKRYYEQSIENFSIGGHESFLARCHNNLGESLTHHGLWTQAAEHLEIALALAEKQHTSENEALTLITLAELRMLQGQIATAEQHLISALQILADKDKWAEAYAQRVFGKLYIASAREIEGIAKLQLALQMASDIGDQHGICLSYLELSEYHLEHGNLDQTEIYLETARELLSKNLSFYATGIVQRLSGKLELARGRYQEAQQHLLQSISIFTTNDDQYEVAVSHLEVGKFYLQIEDPTEAEIHLKSAEELFIKLGAKSAINRIQSIYEQFKISNHLIITASHTNVQPSESLLLQRLMDACGARELLLQELIAILHENFGASTVIVWEIIDNSNSQILATTANDEETKTRISQSEQRLTEHQTRNVRINEELAIPEIVRILFERNEQQINLYVKCNPTAFRLPIKSLYALLKQVSIGLEISILRSTQSSNTYSIATPHRSMVLIPGFIYNSAAMREVVEYIRKIRTSDVTVLITGESGTGKELVAHAIHNISARRNAVFVPFNCTTTPRDLIDSQLFGHRRGAFTGAISNYSGIIRAANGGTLFLDEIGDLSLETQPKLMRFLQEGEVHPLGETKPLKVDVRVLAATNVDLENAVSEGRFREDLFHRLNIIRIHVPPLRTRREEIPLLATHYLEHFSKRDGKHKLQISQGAMDALISYDWSGNVRQLRNEIERTVVFANNNMIIKVEDLSDDISRKSKLRGPTQSYLQLQKPLTKLTEPVLSPVTQDQTDSINGNNMTIRFSSHSTLREAVEKVEIQLISETLKRTSHNISQTARQLGLSRRGLKLKIEQLQLNSLSS